MGLQYETNKRLGNSTFRNAVGYLPEANSIVMEEGGAPSITT